MGSIKERLEKGIAMGVTLFSFGILAA